MKSDYDLIVKHFPENTDIKIIPISDVHYGSAEHMAKEWQATLKYVKETPNVYVTLGGDLCNNATRSSVSNIFEETIRPRDQKREMAEMLREIRDRLLCVTTGNHERRSVKDADDDFTYDICCKLDIEDLYRPNICFLKIQMGDISGAGLRNPTYTLAVTHGAGGGIYTGAAVNRNERFGYVIDGIDGIIVGHSHKATATQPGKIFVDTRHNKISIKPFKVITSTAFLEYGGYAAQKMLLPSSFAPQIITLCGKHKEMLVTM